MEKMNFSLKAIFVYTTCFAVSLAMFLFLYNRWEDRNLYGLAVVIWAGITIGYWIAVLVNPPSDRGLLVSIILWLPMWPLLVVLVLFLTAFELIRYEKASPENNDV